MPEYTPPSGGGSGTIDGTLTAGRIAYAQDSDTLTDDADFTYDATNDLLAVTKVTAQSVLAVNNQTVSAIPAGTPVFVKAVGSGGRPNVEPADADDTAKMPSVGIVTNQISSANTGYVATNGQINGLDGSSSGILVDGAGSAYTIQGTDIGKTLYVSPTAGKLTTTRPTGDEAIQNVGRIVDINGSNFKMQVSNIGRSNDVPNFIDFADAKGIRDSNQNEQLIFQETASAVNYIEITNAAAGNDVKISTTGSDTNVGLDIETKGDGLIALDGKVLCGTEVGSQGTAARALNLIGEDAVMRIARTSSLAHSPAMELIHLTADGNTSNAYFDVYVDPDKLRFRDRKTGAPGLDILTLMEGSGNVGIQTTSPTATLDVVDGGTFRSTRLLTVSSVSGTLSESSHAGRYLICSGNVTLPATSSAGEHYTILNTTGGDITIGRNGNNINGAAADATVGTYNGATAIAIGSNNWIVLGV